MNTELNFAVSTLAFLGKSPEKVIEMALKNNLTIEFSSGMPYRSDMKDLYLNAGISRLPHNYFPAPETPFVLNLASTNQTIRELSIRHCVEGLKLAFESQAPFFSAHAGFCIDPKPEQLGRQLNTKVEFNRGNNWKHFINSVKILANEAEKLGIMFLIENNVLASFNLTSDNINPLLCCNGRDIEDLINEVDHPSLGLLLDTAHLKVSANTLNFSADETVVKLQGLVYCVHHSDNDGKTDTNERITDDYWFLKHMQLFKKTLHILEVKKQAIEEILAQKKLLSSALN